MRVQLLVVAAAFFASAEAFTPRQLRVPRSVASTVRSARQVGQKVAPGESLAERLQGKVAKPDGGRGERPRGPGEVTAAKGVQLGEGKSGNAT